MLSRLLISPLSDAWRKRHGASRSSWACPTLAVVSWGSRPISQ